MIIRLALVLSALVLSIAAGPALAEVVPDPDWPCVQRRQPQLSVAQVWAGPAPDAAVEERAKAGDVQQVAQIIALRRTSMEEAAELTAAFAETADDQALTALFLATFQHIQKTRDRVMGGITRYAHKQEALDAHIDESRHAFDALMAAEPQDFDAIDKAEEDIDWSTRIFQDRQQSLTYVCETPVLLEQRVFALGRLIAGHLKE